MKVLLVLLVVLFFGCEDILPVAQKVSNYVSFEDVSDSYRSKYGTPEDIEEYKSMNYHSIDWWWWSKGFMVNFLDSAYDNIDGWTVDHTYSFDPIY